MQDVEKSRNKNSPQIGAGFYKMESSDKAVNMVKVLSHVQRKSSDVPGKESNKKVQVDSMLSRPVKKPRLDSDHEHTSTLPPPVTSGLQLSPSSVTDSTHHHTSTERNNGNQLTFKTAATISTNQFYSKPSAGRQTTATVAMTTNTPAKLKMKGGSHSRNHSDSSDSNGSKVTSGDPSDDLSGNQHQVSMEADMAELFGTSDGEEEVWESPAVSFETALTSSDHCIRKPHQANSKAALKIKALDKQTRSTTPRAGTYQTSTSERSCHDSEQNVTEVQVPSKAPASRTSTPPPPPPPPGELINLTALASRHKSAPHTESDNSHFKKGVRKRVIAPAKPLPRPTYTILKKKTDFVLTGPIFYDYMKTYILTEEQLVANGYPRLTSQEGTASIKREVDSTSLIQAVGPNAMRHTCARCGKHFTIYNSGGYQSVEECSYHFGRLRKSKEYGEGVVSVFSCCQGRQDSLGCQVAKMHVTAGEQPSLESGYVQALPAPAEPGYTPAVYSVDCEMCYTTKGLQLTRVTVVDRELHSVYETLVKPSHPIVDYNTIFSGLTSESLASVHTSLEDVQQHLCGLFYEDTILVGHSLESDLRAMKFIHSTVVDTSIVFPHPRGPPYKRALKSLMAEYLQRFIQDNIDGGHDSREDAAACMELMQWKVKADMLKSTRR